MILIIAQLELGNAIHQLDHLLIALGHGSAQLVAVDIDIVKQAAKIILTLGAPGGILNAAEHAFQCFIQVFILRRALQYIFKKLAGQDEVALGTHKILPLILHLFIAQPGIVKIGVTGFPLVAVDVVGEIFGYIAIEQHAQHILLKIPAIHAAPQVIGDPPDGTVKLRAFLFLAIVGHDRLSCSII